MRFITTTGVYGSGSSAITDLIREYSNVEQPTGTDFELLFFFGYHGIENLRYWIVDGKNQQHAAIHDFLSAAGRVASLGHKMNYEKYFQGHFMEATRKYVRQISGTKCGERYYVDLMRLSDIQLLLYRLVNKLHSIPNVIYSKTHSDVRQSNTRLFSKKESVYLYDITEEEFINETKKYINYLFGNISRNKKIIMLEALTSTHNLDDISMYFDDLRIVIVRRDPRDVYVSVKYIWKTENIPCDPKDFCTWFTQKWKSFSYKKSIVKEILFEELIFNYTKTISELEMFLNLSEENHIEKQKYFKPNVSINNCRLWKKYPQEADNIRLIEKSLPEWLYPFPD